MLTKRFDDALVWAADLHRTQQRKGTTIPYIAHLMGVASIALENGCDEDQAIAALLHDAIEDQGVEASTIAARFGPAVAAIVTDCTDDVEGVDRTDGGVEGWRLRKQAYLAHMANKPLASMAVSLADKTHNAQAIVADLAVHRTALWDRFNGGRAGSLWYYRSLADAFRARMPGAATERFARLVDQMEAAAS